MLTVRHMDMSDLEKLHVLIKETQDYFVRVNIPQWIGYPTDDIVKDDIKNREGYVVCDDSGNILAMFSLTFGGQDDAYDKIINGAWNSDMPYAAIHRMSVTESMRGHGLAGDIVEFCVSMCMAKGITQLRGDTHSLNKSMQRMFEKNGFTKCGNVFPAEEGSVFVAYERLL